MVVIITFFCMRKGSIFGALTGKSGVKIDIRLSPTGAPQMQQYQQQMQYGQQQQMQYGQQAPMMQQQPGMMQPYQQQPGMMQQQQPYGNDSNSPGIFPMDHYPSWKLHRNPFWRVK